LKRYRELERRGLTRIRKGMQQRREIRKEMEDAYDKEGDDVWIKGDWVKTKTVYDKSKTNKEVANYTPSFRRIIPDDMNPVLLVIYMEIMKEIVDEYKEKRKKEAAIRKREKEKEKQMKLMKINLEEKPLEKVEVKKSISSIVKNIIKPIKVEKTVTKPIIISKPKSEPIIILKPKEISISKIESQLIIISKKEEPIVTQPIIEIKTDGNPITDDKETDTSKKLWYNR
jgi:hypothetical protein